MYGRPIESDDDIAALFVVERTEIAAPGLGGGTAGGTRRCDGQRQDRSTTAARNLYPGGDRIVLAHSAALRRLWQLPYLRSTADRERDQKMGYVER